MITAIAAVALAAVLALRATRPGNFQVRRSMRIEAPPEKIRELIDDFHRWASWSPYEDLDPVMRRAYSEPSAGEGAVYLWTSSGRAGRGRMVITESTPSRVVVHLDRAKTRSVAEFTFLRADGATEVTWSIEGSGSLLAERTLGRDLETGLANLKATVERSWYGPRKPARRAPRPRPQRGAVLQPAA